MTTHDQPLFHLRGVRKTYGARQIPSTLFRECRLPEAEQPTGPDWRRTCGSRDICRRECPRCWALSIDELRIHRGRTTAILGHSGSGKTTLLYLLALLHLPDVDTKRFELRFEDGGAESVGVTWRFDGGAWRDGAASNLASLDRIRRRRFGFVFQAGHLSTHLTALQNVGLSLGLIGAAPEVVQARAESILERIDFPRDRFDALPRHLSGGEYQRVAVARALARDPDVLFADEPTGNLDPVTGQAVMELLTTWRAEDPARSLILVTHNVEHALDRADEVVVLNGGEVVLDTEAATASYQDIEQALHRRAPRAQVQAASSEALPVL